MKAILSILLSFTLVANTCKREDENCHMTILFKNNSSKNVYIAGSFGYPDTLSFRNEFPSPALNPYFYKVISNSENKEGLRNRDCYESTFNSVLIPSDTLMVYVFDAHVLETTPWDTVIANYLVLKRYDLSLADLQGMNWTIIYP